MYNQKILKKGFMKNKNSGITLLALVITIIVLLILAGVSISMLSGNNSILKRAGDAKDTTIEGQEKEQVELAYISAAIKKLGGNIEPKDLQDELDISVGKDKTKVTGKGTLKVKFEDTQNFYKVTKNGQVSKDTSGNIPDDIFVALYNDGTLVFSNNEKDIDTSKVTKNYGNIKGISYNSIWAEWAENDYESILKVDILNEIIPNSTASWFYGLYNITDIAHIENINTANVTDMNGMFWDCMNLTSLDVSSFDTSNVTNMGGMFYFDDDCMDNMLLSEIKGLDKFDTTSVTDMGAMFRNCKKLTELDLSSFDTSKVEYIQGMFSGCDKLVTIYGKNWNLSSINNDSSKDIFWRMHISCRW